MSTGWCRVVTVGQCCILKMASKMAPAKDFNSKIIFMLAASSYYHANPKLVVVKYKDHNLNRKGHLLMTIRLIRNIRINIV